MADTRQTWIEVENCYLTNQKSYWAGRGKKREYVPDPRSEPTEANLFCWRCERKGRRIKRTRFLETLKAADGDELDQKIAAYVDRDGVVLIAETENPTEYQHSNQEPVPFDIEEAVHA